MRDENIKQLYMMGIRTERIIELIQIAEGVPKSVAARRLLNVLARYSQEV